MYHSKALVSGRGTFPLDMLRYDRCCPDNSTAVDYISESVRRGSTPVGVTERFEIRLSRTGATKAQAEGGWTPDRWASFGWTCEVIHSLTCRD